MSTSTKGHLIGYVRVSSVDQNTQRQEEQLSGYSPDKTFTDKASGKDTDRPQLEAALAHLRAGDTFIIHSIDRLARNLEDLRRIVRELTDKGVKVMFIKEGLTFDGEDSPMSKLMLSMMGAFAEFERSLIKERQREGIALAKERGAYRGRKAALSTEMVVQLKARDVVNNHKNRAALAREYSISRETLYQYLKQ